MLKKISINIIFLLSISYSFAQSNFDLLKSPLIHSYTTADYNSSSQIWAIAQDSDGLLYFGTNSGLMTFGGKFWKKYEDSINDVIRSIAISPKGDIYIGSRNQFGVFKKNKKGDLIYTKLSDKIPNKTTSFGEVWKTIAINDKAYFFSHQHIFIWENNQITSLNKEITPLFASVVGNEIWIIPRNGDIAILKDTSLVKINGIKIPIKDRGIVDINQINKNEVLISTSNVGIFIYNKKLQKITKIPFSKQVDEIITEAFIFRIKAINSNTFALGTEKTGIIIIDRLGNIKQTINKKKGTRSNYVFDIEVDKYGSIWGITQNGILRADIGYPVIKFDEHQGAEGYLLGSFYYKNSIFTIGMNGVFYLQNNEKQEKFKQIGNISEVWCIDTVDKKLIIGGQSGLYRVKKQKKEFTIKNVFDISKNTIFGFKEYPKNKNYLFIGTTNGVEIIKLSKETGKYESVYQFKDSKSEIRDLFFDKKGNLWVAPKNDKLACIEIKNIQEKDFKIHFFDTKNGLPNDLSDIHINFFDNKLVFSTGKGIYTITNKETLNFDKIKFIKDKSFGELVLNKDVEQTFKISENKYLLKTNSPLIVTVNKNKIEYDSSFFKLINSRISYIAIHKNTIGIPSNEALYICNKNDIKTINHKFKVIINKISVQDSTIYDSNSEYKFNDITKLNSDKNSITFDFSALYFMNSDDIKYQYILTGFDKKWSKLNKNTKAVYTNLPAGKYTFKVKAYNTFGNESEIAEFSFKISPPWYKTYLAYIIYAILFIILIKVLLKLNSIRLIKSKQRLEKIIKERTTEIQNQKYEIQKKNKNLEQAYQEINTKTEDLQETYNEIKHQKQRIEYQHNEIIASMHYAYKIQQAILPIDKYIKQYFNMFIIYRPKDIVSGDSYWYAHMREKEKFSEKKFIACIDCTGHGIPGAFMTMLSNSLLDEIVKGRKITDPAQILTELNTSIVRTLKQDRNNNRDGMDVALCKLEKLPNEKTKVTFSGAKSHMYYSTKDGEVKRIKGGFKTIGGIHTSELFFENTEIILKKGDMLYLATDGYIDQNNPERQRFKTNRFLKLLSEISEKSLINQRLTLEKIFDDFKKSEEQRDDVTIIGLRL